MGGDKQALFDNQIEERFLTSEELAAHLGLSIHTIRAWRKFSVIGENFVRGLDLKSIEKVAAVIRGKKPQTKSYRAVRKNRMDAEFFAGDEFLSSAYCREILTVACMVTKFGFERGYLAVNPLKEFKLPECPEQPYDYWKLSEEDAFLDWLEAGAYYHVYTTKSHSKRQGGAGEKFNKRLQLRSYDEVYDIVPFALRSGLRKGEIGALTRRDVNLGTNCLMVRRSFSSKESRMKETTKGKSFRILEMNDDMRRILEKRIHRAKNDGDLLFNIHINAIKFFSRTCRQSGVKEIHFHSLRHPGNGPGSGGRQALNPTLPLRFSAAGCDWSPAAAEDPNKRPEPAV